MAVVTRTHLGRPTIQIDYSQFFVVDVEHPDAWVHELLDWNHWFEVMEFGAGLGSWGHLHTPKVTVEVWEGEPPPVEGYERTEEHEIHLPSRRAQLTSLLDEPSESWPVPRPHVLMRASTRGKDAILAAELDTESFPPRDIEEWLIQFH